MKHIQWFPGHMTKAMRMMEESLALVDGVLFVLDARAPAATYNKKLKKLFGAKPVLFLLNKSDLADPAETDAFFSEISKTAPVVSCAATAQGAAAKIAAKLPELLRAKFAKDEAKGMKRPPRLLVAGIPNTGKSTVINAMSGEKRAVTGDKAGVTRGKQWIRCGSFELLDTPGTMPPAFENQQLAKHLAYIGSVNDDILDLEDVALALLEELAAAYPAALAARYGIGAGEAPLAMYEQVCRARGFLLRGGEYDYSRAAKAVLDDLRKGRLGRITLERAADFRGFFG